MFRRALTRCAVAGVLAIAAVGLASASAMADAFVQILCPLGGCSSNDALAMDLSTLGPPDVTNGSYRVTTPDGKQQTVSVNNGYSLHALLGDFGDSSPFGFAEVIAPNLYSYLVPSEEATSTSSDPPVVWFDGTSVHFADAAGDYVTQPNTIVINLHAGSILTVNASTTTRGTVAANAPVPFKLDAPVTGQAPGASLTYEWVFDDGATSSHFSTTHRYSVAGTYDAYLRVSASGDSLGFSQVIPITVGKAPKGPNRQGGGTSKKKKSPTSGAGVKGSSGKKSGAKNGAGNATTDSTTSTPTTATTPLTPSAKPTVKPPASHHAAARRASPPAGPLLSGIPISGPSVPSRRAASRSAATPGVPNPARTGHLTPRGHGLGEGFWIALCTFATLIGGALLEWKGPPRIPTRARLVTARLG